MKFFIKPTLFVLLFLLGIGAESAMACDRSSLTLDNINDIGNDQYEITLTYTCGAGNDGTSTGAAQNTGTYAFFVSGGATVINYPGALTSPQTGTVYAGFTTYQDTVLAYSSNTYWWACVLSTCGPIQTVSQTITITTQGLPESIELLGMEGGGNPAASCMGLVVYPACGTFAGSAGADQTVYYGYAPEECATLTASGSDGSGNYSYAWSTGETNASITVCPTQNTEYTVTVTDNVSGCTSVDHADVLVVDVRCGNKVTMCKPNGTTRCVNSSKVQEKLDAGWSLGACNAKSGANAIEESITEVGLTAGPNPFGNHTRIALDMPQGDEVALRVFNMMGQEVAVLQNGPLEAGTYTFDLDGSELSPGFYVAKVALGNGQQLSLKLIRE